MEETPVLQIKINNLTAELLKTKTVLDQTRQLLKSAEQESRTLKATLEGVLNNKQEGPVRKIMSDIVEVISNMKFQSPIVRKGS